MTPTVGLQIEKNIHGQATHIRFELKNHGESLKPILQKLGINLDEVDEFEQDWKNGVTGDEVRKQVYEHLKTLPWKSQL